MRISIFLIIIFSNLILLDCSNDKSINISKNTSDTIKIGNQIWMNKNLNVDHYRNGDTIPEITNGVEWPNLTTGAWCYYHNSDSLGNIYGKLYNWYAVNDPRGLAPQGWHVATDSDWIVLVNYLGGPDIAGGKLKEEGTRHWLIPNSGANNQSGFSAPCRPASR